jgi:hypothetical protein
MLPRELAGEARRPRQRERGGLEPSDLSGRISISGMASLMFGSFRRSSTDRRGHVPTVVKAG